MNKTLILLLAALGIVSDSAIARTWTEAATGRTVEADFVRIEGEKVVVRMKNGTVSQFAISRLSEADKAFLKQQPTETAAASSTPSAKPNTETRSAGKDDVKRAILGTWEGYMADSDGSRHGDIRLEITEDRITASNPQGNREMGAGTFKINGRKIDATGTEGQFSGRKYEGIIDLDGKTLKWCSANDNPRSKRPDKFQTNTQAGQFLMVLEKK